MLLKRLLNLHHTLAFRLTLWYAVLFIISSILSFSVFYFLMISADIGQIDHRLIKEFNDLSKIISSRGKDDLIAEIKQKSKIIGEGTKFYRLMDGLENIIAESDMTVWGQIEIGELSPKKEKNQSDYFIQTQLAPERKNAARHPKVRILYGSLKPDLILQTGEIIKSDKKVLSLFQTAFTVMLFILIFLAWFIGSFMARRALLGVSEVTKTAQDISKGELSTRVPIKSRGYEIEQLAVTFNTMLDRIESLVSGMKNMVDNITHDLRTPITRIRGSAEMVLTGKSTPEEYEAMASKAIEECDRLLEMRNTLLYISEVKAGVSTYVKNKLDIAEMFRDACDLFMPLAEEREVDLEFEGPDSCIMYGDVPRLQRMISNLLDNSLKYTPAGGSVKSSLCTEDGKVIITCIDTGIGIPEKELPKIFKRFYRCDKSRSQPGKGLGLSLTMAIVRAHGGDITVKSCPNQGSTFTVIIPILPHE